MELTHAEIKNIKKLKDKKYRKLENLFLVEGIKSCQELVKSDYEIKYTLSSNINYQDFPNFVLVDYEVLKSIATTSTPQDIICVCCIPKIFEGLPKGNSLILDELQDPGNIGTLIRSAVAFNFDDIYFINCADIYSEKVIRSSMGAIFKIKAHLVDRDYLINNKSKLFDHVIATDLKSERIERIDTVNKKVAVIIGNEGNGVSKEMLNLADSVVTLPMTDRVESLNAGIAGSIMMYEIFKR